MRRYIAVVLMLSLAVLSTGCGDGATKGPAPEAPPAAVSEPATSTTSAPTIDGSRTLVAVTLPPLLVADKTDDDIVIEATKEGIFDVEINDDRSITYRMTMDEHDALLDRVTSEVDAALTSLVDGPDAVASFRSIEHDDYRHFTIEVDRAEWDSVHSFWSMEVYKWAMTRQAVSGTPLDDLQVVVDFVDDATGAVIHTNDSKAEGA